MAHACAARSVASRPENGATVYIDDIGVDIVIPEDTFTPDGWPTTIRFVGPGNTFGSGTVIDIDSDD